MNRYRAVVEEFLDQTLLCRLPELLEPSVGIAREARL